MKKCIGKHDSAPRNVTNRKMSALQLAITVILLGIPATILFPTIAQPAKENPAASAEKLVSQDFTHLRHLIATADHKLLPRKVATVRQVSLAVHTTAIAASSHS